MIRKHSPARRSAAAEPTAPSTLPDPQAAPQAAAPVELELKLALDPADASRLRGHPLLLAHAEGPAQLATLETRYHDTADSLLQSARMALRLRRDGGQWWQTLKTTPSDASAISRRGEWEHALAGPRLDWPLLQATPLAALAPLSELAVAIKPRFTTRFRRERWTLVFADGTRAELALDQGEVFCGRGARRRSSVISEVELEFLTGTPGTVWKFAARLARDIALMPLAVSKAERGHELLADAPPRPRKVRPAALTAGQSPAGALSAVLAPALTAMLHNLRHLEQPEPEFIHQARVALRRLRSALRVFRRDGVLARPLQRRVTALNAPLRELGWALGAARDWDVFLGETLPALQRRLGADHDATCAALGAAAQTLREQARLAMHARLARVATARALLQLERLVFEAGQHAPGLAAPGPHAAPPAGAVRSAPSASTTSALQRLAARTLTAQHEAALLSARRLGACSAEELHAARIEFKRLRYVLDMWSPLWPAGDEVYAAMLAEVQQVLGEINDSAVALDLLLRLDAPPGLRELLAARHRKRLVKQLPGVAAAATRLDLADRPWQARRAGRG